VFTRISSVLIKILSHGWLLIFLFLSGCGFQLRSEYSFPKDFNSIYIKTYDPYNKFTKELKNILLLSNIRIDDVSNGSYTLEIINFSEKISMSHYDPKFQVETIFVSVNVTYSLYSPSGEKIINERKIMRNQSVSGSFKNKLAMDTQAEGRYEKLRQDVIISIIYQLSSRKINESK